MGRRKNKQKRRREFESRHVDQLWKDVRKPVDEVISSTSGPIGTTDVYFLFLFLRSTIPISDRNSMKTFQATDVIIVFLAGCSKSLVLISSECRHYFIDRTHLMKHEASKLHKKRVKLLKHLSQPHDQSIAEAAAGMGTVDNGPRLRPRSRSNH